MDFVFSSRKKTGIYDKIEHSEKIILQDAFVKVTKHLN